jgi:signal peptidase I
VPVHDVNREPPDGWSPARWQPQPKSGWRAQHGLFTHPSTADDAAVDWCVYHHFGPRPGHPGEVHEAPITDDDAYNAGHSRRWDETQPVTDVLLSLRVRHAAGPGKFCVRLGDGRREFTVRFDVAGGSYDTLLDGRPLPGARGSLAWPSAGHGLEAALCDGRFLVAVDGQTLIHYAYDPDPGNPPQPTSRPVALGADGPALEISAIRLARDVCYTAPPGVLGRWGVSQPVRLGKDEYFMLGDNSAVSDDSRSWSAGPGVGRAAFYGRPLAVFFPTRQVTIFGWRVQLPNPGGIRYIR